MKHIWVVDHHTPCTETVMAALEGSYRLTRLARLTEADGTQVPPPDVVLLCGLSPDESGLEALPCPVLLVYEGAAPQVLPLGVDGLLPFPRHHPELLPELLEMSLHTLEGSYTFRSERWRRGQDVAQQLLQHRDWTHVFQVITAKLAQHFSYEHMGIFLREGDELVLVAEGGKAMDVRVGYRQPLSLGLVGWVAREGKPLIVPDVRQDPRYYAPGDEGDAGMVAAALYPIRVGELTAGVVGAESARADAFPPEACLTLEILADLLGAVVQQVQDFRLQAKQVEILSALVELVPGLLSEEAPDALLQRVAQMAVDLIPAAQAGSVLLLESDGFHFRAVAGYDEALKALVLPRDNHFVADLLRGRLIHVHHIARIDEALLPRDVTGTLHELGRTSDIEETLVAPFLVRGELLGYLTVDSFDKRRAFTPEDELALGLFASMAAVAVHQARLRQTEREWQALVQTLQELGMRLSGTLDETEIIQSLGKNLQSVIPAHTIIISMFEDDILYLRYSHGLLPHVEEELRRGMPLRRYPLAMEAFQTRSGLLIADSTQEPRWVVMNGAQELSVLIVPFRTQDAVLGFLTLTLDHPYGYTEQHLSLLQSLADVVASALDNARNYAASRRRAEYLDALRRLALQTGTHLDPDAIIAAALQQVMTLTTASGALFYTYDPQNQVLYPIHTVGKGEVFKDLRIKPGEGIVGRVWEQRHMMLVDDYAQWPERIEHPAMSRAHMTIGLPVVWQEQALGVLLVFQEEIGRKYSAADLNVLVLLAQQFAGSLYAAQLYQGLREQRDRLAALAQIDQKIIAQADNSTEAIRVILDQALDLLHLPLGLVALMELFTAPVVYAQGFEHGGDLMQAVQHCWADKRLVYYRLGPDGYQAFDDLTHSECEMGFVEAEDARAALIIPLWIRQHCAGALYLLDRKAHGWSLEEIELARMLGRQASIALEKALLVGELQRRLAETQLLNRLGQMATATLEPETIMQQTCAEIRQFLRADAVFIGKLESDGVRLLVSERAPGVPNTIGDFLGLKGMLSLGEALSERRSFVFADVQVENPALAKLLEKTRTRSLLLVPMMLRGELQWVLIAASLKPGHFRQRDLALLEAVANTIAPPLDNARLYQEAQEARLRIEEAYASLQELDALKSQFIQNVSHELRTPLSIVKGYLDIALDRSSGLALPDDVAHVLAAMNTYTERLVSLVESITAIEDMMVGQLDLRPQSVVAVLNTVVQAVRQLAFRRKITLDFQVEGELPPVALDATQLARAFEHLLDNAIKFNHEGGHIWLRAWRQGEQVWIEVRDDGIGIPPAELERIFERFYQIDGSSTRRYGGLGLGLAVAREVIARHGGRVWATSDGPQRGATFTVVLPAYGSELA